MADKMKEPLSEAQIHQLLPLLSVIAKHIGSGSHVDQVFLKGLLSRSDYGLSDWAPAELQNWCDILLKGYSCQGEEESIIGELQDRGIPEAPAVLVVNAIINPPAIAPSKEEKPRIADLYTTAAHEAYNIWLPDHDWHYDLDWATLPFWIKRDTGLVQKLCYGQDVVSRFIRYRVDDEGIKRKLHDYVPIFLPAKPREIYLEWLTDYDWHNDIDTGHLPQWLINDARLLNQLIHGNDVMGKYIRYKFVNNRLYRKLRDGVPMYLNVKPPIEQYNYWLPDHNWHNDLDWQLLPVWIKGNPKLVVCLQRHEHISGKSVVYKYENNKLFRRLRDGILVRRR
jgi:hypothetical protein